jgi:uncharacterized repeat protein (TIGR02059 family)
VGYTDPTAGNDNSAIQDAAGNDAVSLSAQTVTNNVPDTTGPLLQSAAVGTAGTTLILTYNEGVDAANLPVAGAFTITAGGVSRTVTAVSALGQTVTLTLSGAAITKTQTVRVGYTDPTIGNDTKAVQDTIGNDSVSFSNQVVTNNSNVVGADVTAPVYSSAAVNAAGTTLTLTYNEALDLLNLPTSNAFVITVGGVENTVTGVSASGSTLSLSLTNTVRTGQLVRLNYADPTAGNDANAIQDVAGNDAISRSGTLVTNSSTQAATDTTAPTFVSAETNTDGTQIVLTYNEALDAVNTPIATRFSVKVENVSDVVTVSTVSVSGSTLTLTLSDAIKQGLGVTFTYTDPTAGNDTLALQDVAGNDAATRTDQSVTNNSTSAPQAGDGVLSLGTFGNLLAPVQVEGKWYYIWDYNGNGIAESSGSSDSTSINWMQTNMFQGQTITPSNRTTEINGLTIMLPTAGYANTIPAAGIRIPGTAATNTLAYQTGTNSNPTYDDYAAIWDQYNGTGTGSGSGATVSSHGQTWAFGTYLSATEDALGNNFAFSLNSGDISPAASDNLIARVVWQVL